MNASAEGDGLRVLELFCGIGACSAALGAKAQVVAAVDINQRTIDVYRHNARHPARVATIESISRSTWMEWSADLWWLSPPCQPFTRRGRQRDVDDTRFALWNVMLQRIAEFAPRYVIVENVPPFRQSQAFAQLTQQLSRTGYHWSAHDLCPTELGIPNRRRRCYVIASRDVLVPTVSRDSRPRVLCEYLDTHSTPELFVSAEIIAAYREAMDVVDADDNRATTACFTAAYGRSIVRSGSYLKVTGGIRRFAPMEIARLLGLAVDFMFPPGISLRQQWKLLGNSLSVPATRWVLAHIPELSSVENTGIP